MKNLFYSILLSLFVATAAWGASFSYSESRTAGSKRPSIDTAWVGKNVEIVRSDSSFVLTLNGGRYILSEKAFSFSRLVDENTWMEGFGIKDKIFTLFFEIDNGKSILKNLAIRDLAGATHLFKAEDDPIRWDYVPAVVINSAYFYQKNKHTLVPKITCQSLSPGRSVDLNVRIIAPGGEILKNASSPEGYTFSASVVTPDKTLKIADRTLSWNDQSGIVFGKEKYKIEIYDGQELLRSSTMVWGGPAATSYIVVKSQPVYETCPFCGGAGRIMQPDGSSVNCSVCGGRGKIYTGGYKTIIE